jgi:hypothetical protein
MDQDGIDPVLVSLHQILSVVGIAHGHKHVAFELARHGVRAEDGMASTRLDLWVVVEKNYLVIGTFRDVCDDFSMA